MVVVGAGAAGLWAAECAARALCDAGRAPDVLVLEKTPRAGTKVLASGGTRCNLTTTLPPDAAAALFGRRGERFLRRAFRELGPELVRQRFDAWGVATVTSEWEKVFPESGRAKDVRDALVRACEAAGARIRLGSGVAAIEPAEGASGERDRVAHGERAIEGSGGATNERGAHGWRVRLADGESVLTRRLLLAPGGKSYPATGTTGDGYAWLARLGLPIVAPLPALTPVVSEASWVRELTGIALQDAVVSLRGPDGRVLGRRRRPVLFTHTGLSGPGPMDLSGELAREQARAADAGETIELELAIDLLPDVSRETLVAWLVELAAAPGSPRVSAALPGELPRRLVAAACEQAGLAPDPRANEISRSKRHALVETLKALRVPATGTAGFEKAEVTSGGLALDALDPGTLRVRGFANLWAFGEVIDLDGPIGGLNFQAAFATAELAGRDAARA